jgi:hypothetical protein
MCFLKTMILCGLTNQEGLGCDVTAVSLLLKLGES